MNIVDEPIGDYLAAHCTPADGLLNELARETRETFPSDATMQVGPDEGVLLTLLTRLTGASLAVEVGTFTGYSSICIARGLRPGGRLIACDVSGEWTDIARRYWARAGVADRVDLRLAPAAETLAALPVEPVIDFAFIDADKVNYPVYYEEIVTRTRAGGLIVLDNTLQRGRVTDPSCEVEQVRVMRGVNDLVAADPRVMSVLLPQRDGVTLALRV